MKKELVEKIEKLRGEISTLESMIFDKHQEVERIFASENLDFEGSYVEFFDGDTFAFMDVDRCILSDDGMAFELYGNMIRLDENPLTMEDIDDEVTWGEYQESAKILIDSEILMGNSFKTIRKIDKSDFTFVIDTWVRTMKDKFSVRD